MKLLKENGLFEISPETKKAYNWLMSFKIDFDRVTRMARGVNSASLWVQIFRILYEPMVPSSINKKKIDWTELVYALLDI